jgi:hypothetical protein
MKAYDVVGDIQTVLMQTGEEKVEPQTDKWVKNSDVRKLLKITTKMKVTLISISQYDDSYPFNDLIKELIKEFEEL